MQEGEGEGEGVEVVAEEGTKRERKEVLSKRAKRKMADRMSELDFHSAQDVTHTHTQMPRVRDRGGGTGWTLSR